MLIDILGLLGEPTKIPGLLAKASSGELVEIHHKVELALSADLRDAHRPLRRMLSAIQHEQVNRAGCRNRSV